jgi:CBS-domain-containing membrane protein
MTTREYAALTAHFLKPGSGFLRPVQVLPERVRPDDPAVNVMTDLKRVSVITVRSTTTVEKAHAKMVRYGVRLLLVLDMEEKVVGLLTAVDVLGEKPMRFLQETGGTHAEILVRDIMTPREKLEVLKLQDVHAAKVGNIVATLKRAGRQHAVVVEEVADGIESVCGLFSATQIARQLGAQQIQAVEIARTFAEIEAVLNSSPVS